jgi:hypothetical protein
VGLVPIVLAVAVAGLVGFGIARWAARPVPTGSGTVEPGASVTSPTALPPAAPAAPITFAPSVVQDTQPASAPAPPATSAAPAGTESARAGALPAPARPSERSAREGQPAGRAPAAVEPATPVEPAYALQAVTEQDGQPVAIVNGQLVRVGDVLEGGRIVRIQADAVEIEKDGRRIVLGF